MSHALQMARRASRGMLEQDDPRPRRDDRQLRAGAERRSGAGSGGTSIASERGSETTDRAAGVEHRRNAGGLAYHAPWPLLPLRLLVAAFAPELAWLDGRAAQRVDGRWTSGVGAIAAAVETTRSSSLERGSVARPLPLGLVVLTTLRLAPGDLFAVSEVIPAHLLSLRASSTVAPTAWRSSARAGGDLLALPLPE